ncbi:LysR family transcriptional regulator [Limnohabitans sp. Rim11]|jgi:DNA-binding transcriptional LysR family regulator|uniref:LysR family transcriptional regulator n=1 Tax=Limnohabitans sp. Rim11 TaxID=1100719 RepID=UPI000B065032|nr:LysR family transcriptional regulator [Limnohabitans sp. Rim11]
MNFRQLDLNLLRVLVAIHRTGSVTLAGKSLALSQPATSNALARLRDFFEDELFVRAPTGLKPTRLCEQLAADMHEQLLLMESMLVGRQEFDPANSDVHWKISLSDLGEMMFLPKLAAALRIDAPHARLSNIAVNADQVTAALESREIDLAVGILAPEHRGIRSELLFHERYMAVTSLNWKPPSGRAGKTLSLEQLRQSGFAVASPTATFHGSVEKMLTRMKLEERIVLRSRHFSAMPDIVRQTDLVGIIPEMFVRELKTRQDLRVWDITDAPVYEVQIIWHKSTDTDSRHIWMRDLVCKLFQRFRKNISRQ